MFRPITFVWTLALYSFAFAGTLASAQTADEFSDCKIIRILPKTTAEMERLHRDNSSNQCEPLTDGQSLETTSYATIQTARASLDKTPRPAMRFSIISVGLIMDSSDQADLPMTSRKTILDYIEKHYVSIQVRMRRDLVTGKQYFHHRPLAATANFSGSKVTQPFDRLVSTAVRDFRSVGLFSKVAEEERKPEDLRTLVLMFRNTIVKSESRTASQFEYGFVRGRDGGKGDRLATHVFVTSKDRSELVYLNGYRRPTRTENCSIRGSVVITEFDRTGIVPKESATRSYRLDALRHFPMENIEDYCTKNNLKGGFFANVDTVLDVLIDQMQAKK